MTIMKGDKNNSIKAIFKRHLISSLRNHTKDLRLGYHTKKLVREQLRTIRDKDLAKSTKNSSDLARFRPERSSG